MSTKTITSEAATGVATETNIIGTVKRDAATIASNHSPPFLHNNIIAHVFSRIKHVVWLFWLITQDDAFTFVVPNTVFGICAALAGPVFASRAMSEDNGLVEAAAAAVTWTAVLWRLPHVIFFNWSNLLVFNLANQRLPHSILEDSINKPWRPAPRGLLTSDDIRRAMLVVIPAVWATSYYFLDVGSETALLLVLTWLYNDLRGGDDESWVLRNIIIAAAFGLYNLGSFKVAMAMGSSGGETITATARAWLITVSGVILTTMHVQDLKDQEGDRKRGRQTAPLVLGDRAARWSIAIPVAGWSLFCTHFWGPSPTAATALVLALGAIVVVRCLINNNNNNDQTAVASDRLTWQIWAAWTATLYLLPLQS